MWNPGCEGKLTILQPTTVVIALLSVLMLSCGTPAICRGPEHLQEAASRTEETARAAGADERYCESAVRKPQTVWPSDTAPAMPSPGSVPFGITRGH